MSFARIRRRIERLEAVVEPELPLQDRVFRILEDFLATANEAEAREMVDVIDAVQAARAARAPPGLAEPTHRPAESSRLAVAPAEAPKAPGGRSLTPEQAAILVERFRRTAR